MVKVCRKCKVEKDEDSFYKRDAAKDGLNSWCIPCCRDRQKEFASTRMAIIHSPSDVFKTCRICKKEKHSSEFPRDKRVKDGITGSCKICKKNVRKEFVSRKREQINAKAKIWRQKTGYTKKYYYKNRNKMLANARRDRILYHDRIRLYENKYRIINKNRHRTWVSASKLKARKNLSESYVKQLLIQKAGYPKKMLEQYPVFIRLKQQSLKYYRHAKKNKAHPKR